MATRSVLCFGDSNTYGQVPGIDALDRYDAITRWPGVMGSMLGPAWYVIEEGLPGRTTVRDDPVEGKHKNGRRYLLPCVQTHAPLDLIIIMLGTNDLKARFSQPPSEVAMGIGVLVHDIREVGAGVAGGQPEILIVAPVPTLDDMREFNNIFAGAAQKSRCLALEFEILADSLECHFFDAGSVTTCSPRDGVHIDAEGHRRLGEALAAEVEAIGWPQRPL